MKCRLGLFLGSWFYCWIFPLNNVRPIGTVLHVGVSMSTFVFDSTGSFPRSAWKVPVWHNPLRANWRAGMVHHLFCWVERLLSRRLATPLGTRKGRSASLKPQTDAILYFKLIVMGLFAAQGNEWRLHCATTPLIVSFNVLCISFHSPSYCLEQKHPGPSSLHQSRGGLMSRPKLMAEHIPFWCDRKNS